MDSWTARKRPWEDDSAVDSLDERRDDRAAGAQRGPPPLPQYAGQFSLDSQPLDQRRLPPPHVAACSASAEMATSSSARLASLGTEVTRLDRSRPRSQSLFGIFEHAPRQGLENLSERTMASARALDLDEYLPTTGTGARGSGEDTDPPPAAGVTNCCPSTCEGQACSNARTLMRELASELVLLDKTILHKDYHALKNPREVDGLDIGSSLRWALDLVQYTIESLRDHIETSTTRSLDHYSLSIESSPNMRRGQYLPEREEQSPPSRQFAGIPHGYPSFTHPRPLPDDSRRHLYGSDIPMANSPQHTGSSSGSAFMPPHSPMHAPQSSRSTMLPSPSSMNFPNPTNLPPMSPPASALQSSAQATHLQDLQHQISVKTLAFQTLQREYDSLLQKLERQRTKCATLEKKFEVSDVEINGLTDEKERLQAQIVVLENQVEDLQQNRDEARRQLVANGAQYMRIMEMANRLQSQSAEDKKRWEGEKGELTQRIKVLEEAMVIGTDSTTVTAGFSEIGTLDHAKPARNLYSTLISSPPSSSSTETITVLRTEINRLRARTQSLETALQTMREESITIQIAARQLVESGGKMEKATQGVIGEEA